MSHENDLFIFQREVDTKMDDGIVIHTIIFIRKNADIIYKCEHVKSFFEDEFSHYVELDQDRFHQEVRYFIKSDQFEEIVSESETGKEWISNTELWIKGSIQ